MRLIMVLWVLLFSLSASQKTFLVGVESVEFFPYHSTDAGEFVGFSREVMDRFFKDAGLKVAYEVMPVSRANRGFANDKLDFKFPANPMWNPKTKQDKQLKIFYSEPIVGYVDGILRLPPKDKKYSTLKSIGLIRGYTLPEWLQKEVNAGAVEVYTTNNLTSLLKMTLLGRVDGALCNLSVARYNLSTRLMRPGALMLDEKLPYTASHFHLATLKHVDLIKQFDRWMKKNHLWLEVHKEMYGLDQVR